MDFITRGDKDLKYTELLYGKSSDQYTLHGILLDAEEEMKKNKGLRLAKQCKQEYIVITFSCDEDQVLFKYKTYWNNEKTEIRKQKTYNIKRKISEVIEKDVYDLILNGKYEILHEKVYGGESMSCDKCIYGFFYDTCNADWKGEEYQRMLKNHECPYYKEGRKMFEEKVNCK